MKKVLFVLGFAMCTTMLMAQTTKVVNRVEPRSEKLNVTLPEKPVDYKASIFAKDGEDEVIKTFDFATANMTGVLSGSTCRVYEGDIISGDTVSASVAHGRTEPNTFWFRVENREYMDSEEYADNFPNALAYGCRPANVNAYMGEQNGITDNNGFMFLSLMENMSGSGAMNSYFQLPAVALDGDVQLLDIQWKQYHRRYYDQTFVDYKVEGGWNAIEVNVTGIDVEVNGTSPATYTLTLPPAAVQGQDSLTLRFRAYRDQPVYGYFWCVDNVKFIVPASTTRASYLHQGYITGFYGMVPMGFQLPMVYAAEVRNRGLVDLTGVKLQVNHLEDGESTVVAESPEIEVPAGDALESYLLKIDESGFCARPGVNGEKGFYERGGDSAEFCNSIPDYYQYYDVDDATLAAAGYQRRSLPTETPGKNLFSVSAVSNEMDEILVSDTMAYFVTTRQAADPSRGLIDGYRWANDNGVIAGQSEFAYQFSGGFVSESADENHQYDAGYFVWTRFNTPSVIPVDEETGEPWVLRGIELVTSTKGTAVEDVRITPMAVTMVDGGDGIGLYYLNTGLANNKKIEVTEANLPEPEDQYGFIAPGARYHAVNIEFPNQPEIEPNHTYLFGYENAEGGKFSVAQQQFGYPDVDKHDSVIPYYNNSILADYYNQYSPLSKIYDGYVYDPTGASQSGNHYIVGWNIDRYPLIRAIVGPKRTMPTYEVFLDCGDSDTNYWIGNRNGINSCGQTDTVIENSSAIYLVAPGAEEEGDTTSGIYGHMVIDAIYVNGVAIDLDDEEIVEAVEYDVREYEKPGHENWEPLLKRNAYWITINDINEDITITAKTSWHELAIEDIDNYVKIGLAPNPATSQVHINVAGITGKVECSIIDMSGRTVRSLSFNAGSEQVVDLSSIPAGAYFVRITNDTISKVEKLIVR